MGDRSSKEALFAEFAAIGKVPGNPKRLEIIDLLSQGPRSVEDLATAAALGMSTCSAHLQMLRGGPGREPPRGQADLLLPHRRRRRGTLGVPAAGCPGPPLPHRPGPSRIPGAGGHCRRRHRRAAPSPPAWRRRHTRRPPRGRVRRRAPSRRDPHPALRTDRTARRTASRPRNRRLLPRSILRHGPRCSSAAHRQRTPRPTRHRRSPGVAPGRPTGRDRCRLKPRPARGDPRLPPWRSLPALRCPSHVAEPSTHIGS